MEGRGAVSAGQLLNITNFGILSLIDFMCVAESALEKRMARFIIPSSTDNKDEHSEDTGYRRGVWYNATESFDTLLAATREFYGVTTVGEALQLNLAKLAETIGIASDLDSISIQELTKDHRIANTVIEELASVLASMSEREHFVCKHRLYTSSPMTHRDIGQQIGLTKGRVRQIQRTLEKTLHKVVGFQIDVMASLIGERLGPVTATTKFKQMIDNMFNNDEVTMSASGLARQILTRRLNYSCRNGVYLNQTAIKVVAALQTAAKEVADDVGLIDEEALKGHLPDQEWNDFFPQLIEGCRFVRIDGWLALRDTKKARIKKALLEIGRLATIEEIAQVSGLSPNRLGSTLSAIPSVARADKTRWGLAERIDRVYEGIPAAIIQRINEDGGATSLQGLLKELPRWFGVSKLSVRAYIGSLQFTIRNGYVSLADKSAITLPDVNDVIDGRDSSGNPYWIFKVENRYFHGFSLSGFPPELARELGCEPNGNKQAMIAYPSGCGKLSVIWRLTSPTGASLGHLADPLQRLGVTEGAQVRLVIKGVGVVELRCHNE